jgi:BMFP domain-containing protein YqiC
MAGPIVRAAVLVKEMRPAGVLERVSAVAHSSLEAIEMPAASKVRAMTQTNNRFLDELAKLMTDAAGAAQGMRRDFETMMKAQGERILRDMDVVQREEFEAVKEMAVKAREENEKLATRITTLEAELAALRKA